jgi:hypothetical protein
MPVADAQKTMQTTLTHSKDRRWLMPSGFTNSTPLRFIIWALLQAGKKLH